MPSVSRDALNKIIGKNKLTPLQEEIARLRLEYSNIAMMRNTFVEALRGRKRIYPTILPTQASGRWSYIDPPLSNFPKKCINPECPKYHHARTSSCWSIRDCLLPDSGTFWIEHDLDAVEHRIYCLILEWKERLDALRSGLDIHTPVTCDLFNLPYPKDFLNPHSLCLCSTTASQVQRVCEHCEWRARVKWQGKDDTRRTMSKNFTYGGQYFYVKLVDAKERTRKPFRIYKELWYNPSYVYSIPNIQSYLVEDLNTSSPTYGTLVPPEYEKLAIAFVESNIEVQKAKASVMEKCRRDGMSRSLYGAPRRAYIKNQDAAKELFNHIVQGTVASYIDESCVLLQDAFPESYLVHNQHDSLKWAFVYDSTTEEGKRSEEEQVLQQVKQICQRTLVVGENSIPITATFKIVKGKE